MPQLQTNALFDTFVSSLAEAISARLQDRSFASSKAPTLAGTRRRKGQKRTAEGLAELTSALLGHIKAHPGHRIEQIAVALKLPTKELKLPAQKLLAGKTIKTKGQRRGTHYFAA
jgi:hypothetical protein